MKQTHAIAKEMHAKLGDNNQYEIKCNEKMKLCNDKRKKRNLKK